MMLTVAIRSHSLLFYDIQIRLFALLTVLFQYARGRSELSSGKLSNQARAVHDLAINSSVSERKFPKTL